MHNWKIAGFVATAIIVLTIPIYIASTYFEDKSLVATDALEYIGKERCKDCHQKEYKAWTGSHHDNAMDIATDSTVLADFNNTEFEYNGVTSKFYKKD
ncbi:MAG: multiheme c-type cytochrome, partial [Melioribacteraceae bacterium]|nr:multiheme c-type cytochrome [Melioribacteraceae bacterium]